MPTRPPLFSTPLWIALAIGWTLAILVACSIPGSGLPKVQVFQFDKVAHLVMFGGFGLLWMQALATPLVKRTWHVLVLGTAYGILTEFYQGWLPFDRTPDVFDMLANLVGLVLSLLLFRWLAPRFLAQ